MDTNYFTYVLYSEKFKQLYIGQSNDVIKRLDEHNKGRVPSTKPFRPYKLIYFETFEDKQKAVIREKELKTTQGRRFLKQFIKVKQ